MTDDLVRLERQLKHCDAAHQQDRDDKRREERQVSKLEHRIKELEQKVFEGVLQSKELEAQLAA